MIVKFVLPLFLSLSWGRRQEYMKYNKIILIPSSIPIPIHCLLCAVRVCPHSLAYSRDNKESNEHREFSINHSNSRARETNLLVPFL